METHINGRPKYILVVSQSSDLAVMVCKAAAGIISVVHVTAPGEAIVKIKESRPEIVILGNLGASAEVLRFCKELKEGWISRHSAVLVLEMAAGGGRCAESEELTVNEGEYAFLSGIATPLMPLETLAERLKSKITEIMAKRRNKLKTSMVTPGDFCIIWEQIPGLGAFELRQEGVLHNAAKAARGGKICAISVTDNPGGNPAIANEILSGEIRRLGVEPLVHVAFRDRSRNQVESLLYQLAAMDINNVLVLSGDYPSNAAFLGTSRPVFDLDSVNGLQLITQMNRGMPHEIMRRTVILSPTDFFAGVAFSPYKRDEAEVMGQFYKLKKKIECGAGFIITQIGFDIRKLHELQMWLKRQGYRIPTVASIYILPLATARAMYDNHIPGCVVTNKLLAQVEREATNADRGRRARLERAAKMYAIARGLGFNGVSISGQDVPYDSVEYVINRGEELKTDWLDYVHEYDYPQEGGFYYFERDEKTGLNLEIPVLHLEKPVYQFTYYFSRAIHAVVFEPKSLFYKLLRRFSHYVEGTRLLKKIIGTGEFWIKVALYGCMNCGDCALYDVAYQCPVSRCPKNQRNGPCGGSYLGWCEVYPGRIKCVWVKAYRRLKAQHREDSIGEHIVPPNDWSLWGTSSWLNYFMGRDYLSKRIVKRE